MYGIAIEISLFVLLLVQLALLGMGERGFWSSFFTPATYLGYCISLGLGIVFWSGETASIFYGSLRNDLLFQPLRWVIVLIGLALVRMLMVSREIGEARKKEIVILFSANTLLGCVLILSQNLLLSFMLLGALGLLSSLLVGISFFNRQEFEGARKNWNFVIAAICFGFGALGILAMAAGSLAYVDLRTVFAQPNDYSFVLLTLCLIPFFWVGGIFPFHFFAVDRDHAARWPIQAHLSCQIVGCVVLALLRALVMIFGKDGQSATPSSLVFISYLGLAGAIWGGLAAFSQTNGKRHWAYMSLGLWSLTLISVGAPTPLGLASGLLWATTAALGQGLFISVMGRLSERAKSSDLATVTALGHPRAEIGFLLLGLCSILALPPMPGFISFLHLLAASTERASLVFLILLCLVFLIFLVSALRICVSFTRQFMGDSHQVDQPESRMHLLDYSLATAITLLLVVLGAGWDSYFTLLMQQAKAFIIS